MNNLFILFIINYECFIIYYEYLQKKWVKSDILDNIVIQKMILILIYYYYILFLFCIHINLFLMHVTNKGRTCKQRSSVHTKD